VTLCLFATDLHGQTALYQKLFTLIAEKRPAAVFLGGDLLPSPLLPGATTLHEDFLNDYLASHLARLENRLGPGYPDIFVILGNDDGRAEEAAVLDVAARNLWTYVHGRRIGFGGHEIYGYAYVPPTPFRLKDWERYDVSRHVDPGCLPPEEGSHSVPVAEREIRNATIDADLKRLAGDRSTSAAVFLFHAPPYQTNLDRAGLDGQMIDHVPLDVHVGSIAIRRFIEARQPLVTLHGHVHESARLTGSWRDRIGRTEMFTAAHDGSELAAVWFHLEDPAGATRVLV